MGVRKWLKDQHCLWPPIHEKWHEKRTNADGDFWVCKYCTQYVHERFTIEGIDPDDPTKIFATNKATGKLHKLRGNERLKPRFLLPGQFKDEFLR